MQTPQVRADLLIRHLRAAEADLLLFFTGSPPRSAKAHGPLPAVSAEGRVPHPFRAFCGKSGIAQTSTAHSQEKAEITTGL